MGAPGEYDARYPIYAVAEVMNQAFDPGEMARSTSSLQVGMVRRESDGSSFEVEQWMPTMTLGDIHSLRPRLRQGQPDAKLTCFCCGHDVLLRQHASGGHYFAHKEKTAAEKAQCLYQQDQGLSLADRDRLRYHGQREGQRHIRTKEFIRRILSADHRFAVPVVEKTWTSFSDGWRKPDVASVLDGLPVVFEAQVSNTYPQIVAERTEFYRKQGALLVWIFDHVPETGWRALHADTFCSNEQHLFVADEECAVVSEATGRAHFRIYRQRPDVEPFTRPDDQRILLNLVQREICTLVPFASLSLDAASQTATLFDVVEERRRASHKILCAEAQAGAQYEALENVVREVIQTKAEISRRNIEGWAALVCAIESRRLGRAVGTKMANPVSVLNLVHDNHEAFFPHLVETLQRLNIPRRNERIGKWELRVEAFHKGRYKEGPIPIPHKGSRRLLSWLYPDGL